MVPDNCEDEVVELLLEIQRRASRYNGDPEAGFNAEQNALVIRNAEKYYRAMVRTDSSSWNVRDEHMMETLDRLIDFHGPDAKGIVWAHNTHVGDARYTDMAQAGMFNIGQLARDGHQEDGVVLVGFGSHRGSVIAGGSWGAPMERMEVPPGRSGSWEDVLHQSGGTSSCNLIRKTFLTPSKRSAAIVPSAWCITRNWRAAAIMSLLFSPGVTMPFCSSIRPKPCILFTSSQMAPNHRKPIRGVCKRITSL